MGGASSPRSRPISAALFLHFRLWATEFGTVHSSGPLTQHRNPEWTQLLPWSCDGPEPRGCCLRVRLRIFLIFFYIFFFKTCRVFIWFDFSRAVDISPGCKQLTARLTAAVCIITMRSPHLLSVSNQCLFVFPSAHQLRASMALAAVTAACRLQHLTPWPLSSIFPWRPRIGYRRSGEPPPPPLDPCDGASCAAPGSSNMTG